MSGGNSPQYGWFSMVSMQISSNILSAVEHNENSTLFGRPPKSSSSSVSRYHFQIYRGDSSGLALMKVFGRLGVYVKRNDITDYVDEDETKILRTNDVIGILYNQTLVEVFRFIDNRIPIYEFPIAVLNKYHIGNDIGKGGQGSVKKVYSFDSGEKFAIKIISKMPKINELKRHYQKRLELMDNEVKYMRTLNHPHVIKFVESFATFEKLFIVMEFADTDLDAHLMRNYPGRRMTEVDAKFCFAQVTKGVAHIHSKNICHRDIKTPNIFVKYQQVKGRIDFACKIGDFGFSKKVEDHLLTQLGTKEIFPPEILNSCGEYTLKADIWTLGCLFFACFTGKLPFNKHAQYPSLEEQISNGFIKWGYWPNWQQVDIRIVRIIETMIEIDPEQRPSATEILEASWFNDGALKQRIDDLYQAIGAVNEQRLN